MRSKPFFVTIIFLVASSLPYAQTGSTGSVGKKIAPGIEVIFARGGPSSCTWRFRNSDPTRTLASMRFTYTYSSSPLGRVGLGSAGNQTGEDTLAESLMPFEESRSDNVFRAPAACPSVSIHVTNAQWM